MEIFEPTKEDGDKVYDLIDRLQYLDLNASYCYSMLCDYFKQTCAVIKESKDSDKVYGFVSGFLKPSEPSTLFIWQIGLDPELKGQGFGKRLLFHVVDKNKKVLTDLETTITDTNVPSRKLFESLAREYKADISKSVYLEGDQIAGAEGHEPEMLYRIGKLHFS
jgi:L-2,4-diaminobutyric acid acetyltransferase